MESTVAGEIVEKMEAGGKVTLGPLVMDDDSKTIVIGTDSYKSE